MAEVAAAKGVEQIEAAFAAARADDRAALMPYMMGGFPIPPGPIRSRPHTPTVAPT